MTRQTFTKKYIRALYPALKDKDGKTQFMSDKVFSYAEPKPRETKTLQLGAVEITVSVSEGQRINPIRAFERRFLELYGRKPTKREIKAIIIKDITNKEDEQPTTV